MGKMDDTFSENETSPLKITPKRPDKPDDGDKSDKSDNFDKSDKCVNADDSLVEIREQIHHLSFTRVINQCRLVSWDE